MHATIQLNHHHPNLVTIIINLPVVSVVLVDSVEAVDKLCKGLVMQPCRTGDLGHLSCAEKMMNE